MSNLVNKFLSFFLDRSVNGALKSVSTAVAKLEAAKNGAIEDAARLTNQGVQLEKQAAAAYEAGAEALTEANRAARIITRLNDLVA